MGSGMRRSLVLASLFAGFVGLALHRPADAAPMPAFSPAAQSAAHDPSLQQVYWYWWHGRRYWRPGYYRPYYVAPVAPGYYAPPYGGHYWHRRWYGGGWHYW